MISFLLCLAILIVGYFVYGKIVDNTFGPDDRETPAVRINDGVDYVVMPQWKLFLVQLLNIAGLGPIFGAMQGALWGPVVFLWITFGTIFAGGVHDYFSGMMSERNDGASIAEITGKYLGPDACDRASRTVHGNHQGELRGEARSSLARPSCFRAPRDIAMSRCGRAPGDA